MSDINNQQQNSQSTSGIRRLLKTIRRYWILILCTIIIVTAIGAVYGFMRKPNYTASEYVSFTVKNTAVVDAKGNFQENSTEHLTAARAYLDTVKDFISQRCVIDEANQYYTEYLVLKNKGWNISDFVEMKRQNALGFTDLCKSSRIGKSFTVYCYTGIERQDFVKYDDYTLVSYNQRELVFKDAGGEEHTITKEYLEDNTYFMGAYFTPIKVEVAKVQNLISSGNLTVKSFASTTDTTIYMYYYLVQYKDSDSTAAVEKVKTIVLAADQVAKIQDTSVTTTSSSYKPDNSKYFGVFRVNLIDMNTQSVAQDVSKKTIIIIAFLISIVLAIIVVAIACALDRTVHDKEVLESLTGAKTLACIKNRKEEDK